MPYDFSKPFFPSTATDKNQPTNINLFTNPIPFYPVDLSKPFFPGNAPAAPLPVNPNLYVVVTGVPFIPIDFSKQYFPRLFVYHSAAEVGSKQSETFKVMDRGALSCQSDVADCSTRSG
jgi:hypothetical protein